MHIPSKERLKTIGKFKRTPLEKLNLPLLTESRSTLEAFLYSGVLFKFTSETRQNLINDLIALSVDEQEIRSYNFLLQAFDKQEWCLKALEELLKGNSIEGVLSYLEHCLNVMLQKNSDIDGVRYSSEIILSKHSFLLSTIPTAIILCKKNKLPYKNGKKLRDNNKSKLLILILGQYHSIRRQIFEVLKGTYIPKNLNFLDEKYGANVSFKYEKKCEYFLQRAPSNLDSIEIYRDLNYQYFFRRERNIEKEISILKSSGALKSRNGGRIMHFDMSKNKEYERELTIQKITDVLTGIYGSIDCDVKYLEITFKIHDLLHLSRKIINFVSEISRLRLSNCKQIPIYSQQLKELTKQMKLSKLEEMIFPLFSTNLCSNKLADIENLPFFNNLNTYYMFTPLTIELCYEKVLDKVLSRSDVVINTAATGKGYLFEDKILKLFKDSGFEVGKINHSEKKKIPEIDGIIDFNSENLLLIEAKCSIKPEGRSEVFSFIENHLSKAAYQLEKRVAFIKNRPSSANERLKFNVHNKKIIPLIVTNHSFFSGHKFVTDTNMVIYCIDELLLDMIISKRFVPEWIYSGKADDYFTRDKKLKSNCEMLRAILEPTENLKGKAPRIIQPLASGAVIEISKQPNIDRIEELKAVTTFQQ